MRVLVFATTFLALATLIRPTTQYVPLLMLALLFWKNGFALTRNLVKETIIVLCLFIVILAPWVYRNYAVFGSTELTVQTSSTLFAYLVPSTIALEQSISYEEAAAAYFEREHSAGIGDVRLNNAADYKARAIAELKKHPKGLIESVLVTQYAFFTNDGIASILDRRGVAISYEHPSLSRLVSHPLEATAYFGKLLRGPEALIVFGRLFWIITTLLAIFGVYAYVREKGHSHGYFSAEKFRDPSSAPSASGLATEPRSVSHFVFIVLLIAYFALTTSIIGPGVNGRFRVPVMPFLAMYAGWGWSLFPLSGTSSAGRK